MSNLELLDRAAAATTCDILTGVGYGLVNVGVVTAVKGGIGMVPLTAGALSLLASNYLCAGGTIPDVPGGSQVDGCQEVDGIGTLEYYFNNEWQIRYPPGSNRYQEGVTAWEIRETRTEYNEILGKWIAYIKFRFNGGEMEDIDVRLNTEEQALAVKWRIVPTSGTCKHYSDEIEPIPPGALVPRNYYDQTTNCNYTVQLIGFTQPAPGGPVEPVMQIQGANVGRTGGGVIGGCNFPPTVFSPGGGSGGGPPFFTPIPPGPTPPGPGGGVPWWAAPLLAGSTAAALNLIGQAIDEALQARLPAGSFTLTAPCNVDAEGNPLTRTWSFPEQTEPERSIAHQIIMLEALQTHLNWKTPTCGNERPELEGSWISTRWVSDGISPGGERPLRKLFRYRSKSTRDAEQLRAYWGTFTWIAGPVCVFHKGAWWGTPQVWASTEEEGRRVIRAAAAEAGLDPDQIGEWGTSSSSSPRYGMSGTMRLEVANGVRWVTRRDGPSGVPN